MVLWTHGVQAGRISENLMVAVLATNQAKVHGLVGRKGVIAPGADADIVVWDPDLSHHRHAGQPPRQRRLHALRGDDVHRRPGRRLPPRRAGLRATARCSRSPAPGSSSGARSRSRRPARRSADGGGRRRPRGREPQGAALAHRRRGRRAARGLDGHVGRARASGSAGELDGIDGVDGRARRGRQRLGDAAGRRRRVRHRRRAHRLRAERRLARRRAQRRRRARGAARAGRRAAAADAQAGRLGRRGGRALRPLADGLLGVRGHARPRRACAGSPTATASRCPTRSPRTASSSTACTSRGAMLEGAPRLPGAAHRAGADPRAAGACRSAPCSARSAWSATRCASPARTRTPARRRWTSAATPSWPRRAARSPGATTRRGATTCAPRPAPCRSCPGIVTAFNGTCEVSLDQRALDADVLADMLADGEGARGAARGRGGLRGRVGADLGDRADPVRRRR